MPEMHIHDVPAGVWAKIVADAEEQDTSRTEVAVAILAKRFRVKREPSKARHRATPVNVHEALKLRVPVSLHGKLRMEAARTGGTIRGVVVAALAEHYGLPVPSTGRKPRS